MTMQGVYRKWVGTRTRFGQSASSIYRSLTAGAAARFSGAPEITQTTQRLLKVFFGRTEGFILNRAVVMSITYQIFQKASSYLEKYAGETFSPDAGQRSRAIIPATIRETRSHPSGAASVRNHACVISHSPTGNADVHHLTR
jgi:hypothetical protein